MSTRPFEDHKAAVRRLVTDVMVGGDFKVLDQIFDPRLANRARAWITPFRASFSELDMEIVDLVAENDTVAARFLCSGTHTGDWLGHPPTGRRSIGCQRCTSSSSPTAASAKPGD